MEPRVDVRPGILAAAVRRRWRVVVLGLLIGVLASTALVSLRGPAYTATATVLLNPLPGNPYSPTTSPGRTEELTSLETEAALVSTEAVANEAVSKGAGQLETSAVEHVSVVVASNSKVLRISFTGGSPAQARIGAQAFADAYLAYRHSRAQDSADEQVAQLNAQVKTTRAALKAASEDLADLPEGSPSIPLLQQQLQAYASEIAQLQIEMSGLRNSSYTPGDVITPARQPSQPDGLPIWLIAAVVTLVGAGVGVILALWREYSDDRVRDAEDIAALGGGRLVATVTPASIETLLAEAVNEDYRLLRSATIAQTGDSPAVVGVAPVGPGIDVTEIAFGLAAALERSGRRVILVVAEAGPTRPSQWWMDGTGLSDLLRQPKPVGERLTTVLHEVRQGLLILSPGHLAPEMIDRYQSTEMAIILTELRAAADLVVVATPPLTTATGKALADLPDFLFFAVRLDRSRHSEVVEAAEEVSLRRANLIGTIGVVPTTRRRRNWLNRLKVRPRSAPVSMSLRSLSDSLPSGGAGKGRGPGVSTPANDADKTGAGVETDAVAINAESRHSPAARRTPDEERNRVAALNHEYSVRTEETN